MKDLGGIWTPVAWWVPYRHVRDLYPLHTCKPMEVCLRPLPAFGGC